jgi:REP element-mobilizing transposase RayT
MGSKRELLVPGGYYHVYNHAVSDDLLFTKDREYEMFLRKYFLYSGLIFKTYCYCLLPNHFHFLIQVKEEPELNKHIGIFPEDKARSNYLAQHLGNFFNWYATLYNKRYDRKGSLFIHSFKRKKIDEQSYLNTLACYIHSNPIKAGLCKELLDWKHSSYHEYIEQRGFLPLYHRQETINWFEDLDNFIFTHHQYCQQHLK